MSVSSGRRAPSQIRDRIVGLRRVRADELLPNPKNWRRHPKAQADALKGLLGEIGYADALLPAGPHTRLADNQTRRGGSR